MSCFVVDLTVSYFLIAVRIVVFHARLFFMDHYFQIVQYGKNGGKCGICGDDWSQSIPRDHEAGGRYGNGIIGRKYSPSQVSTVKLNSPN